MKKILIIGLLMTIILNVDVYSRVPVRVSPPKRMSTPTKTTKPIQKTSKTTQNKKATSKSKYKNVSTKPVVFQRSGVVNVALTYFVLSSIFRNSEGDMVSEMQIIDDFVLDTTNQHGVTNSYFISTNAKGYYNYNHDSVLFEDHDLDLEIEDVDFNHTNPDSMDMSKHVYYHNKSPMLTIKELMILIFGGLTLVLSIFFFLKK